MRISEIDKNFEVKGVEVKDGIEFFNVDSAPFRVFGVFKEGGRYRRMPEAVAKSVSEGVYALHTNTAGGRVRFMTDSDHIAIKAVMDGIGRMPHFAYTGAIGFDMYVDNDYHSSFVPPLDITDGYESSKELGDRRMREICINFPLYTNVKELYVGLREGSSLKEALPYRDCRPMVYYGSSITQGGCASRPGTSYQSIVSRAVGYDFVNLGFSGNAKAQDEMIDYISGLDMSMFVMDYDHNASTVEYLRATHEKAFLKIRSANPNIPIIIMQRPQAKIDETMPERCDIVNNTYQNALKRGDNKVYLITSESLTELCGNEGTVDGVHPTDLGFASMARAVIKTLTDEVLPKL